MVVKLFGFIKSGHDSCLYNKFSGTKVNFLILYVDDILLIQNNVMMSQEIKNSLERSFSMKDLGETTYILVIRIYRDRSKKLIGLSQSTYLDKVLKQFKMESSKNGFLLMSHGVKLRRLNVLRLLMSGCDECDFVFFGSRIHHVFHDLY